MDNIQHLPDLSSALVSEEIKEWKYEDSMQDYLLTLLHTSTFESRVWVDLEKQIESDLSKEEYDHLIFMLQNNQLDRISSGLPYGQEDIIKHIRKINKFPVIIVDEIKLIKL